MRKRSRAIFVILFASLLCLLSACSPGKKADEQMNGLLETAFNAIQSGDFDTVLENSVVSSEENAAQIRASLSEIQGYIDSPFRYYKILSRSAYRQKILGEPYQFTQYIYRVRALAHEYIVDLTYVTGSAQQGIYNFQVVRSEDAGPLPTHPELSRYTAIALTVLCYGVMLFALIHCLRSRARRKILLCLLILVCAQLGFALRFSASMSIKWSAFLKLFSSASFQTYTNGFEIALLIPLGAVIYLIRRNRWKEKPRNAYFVKEPTPEETGPAENEPAQIPAEALPPEKAQPEETSEQTE